MNLTSEQRAALATTLVAMTPTADRLTQDTFIQTLAAIRDTLERINNRMEEDECNRAAAEQAELAYLRRIAREISHKP